MLASFPYFLKSKQNIPDRTIPAGMIGPTFTAPAQRLRRFRLISSVEEAERSAVSTQ